MTKPLDAKRPTTDEELLDAMVSSLKSLDAHCERFRLEAEEHIQRQAQSTTRVKYDRGPMREVAGAIRLLAWPGQGNDLIARVCDRLGAPAPGISLCAPAAPPSLPWNKVLNECIVIGALPLDTDGKAKPIPDLRSDACLAIKQTGADLVVLTWDDLISTVANKDGVHVDDRRPELWDLIDLYDLHGGVPAIPFMVYRLGVAILHAGNETLRSAGAAKVPLKATPTIGGGQIQAIQTVITSDRKGPTPGRNDPCVCGSGEKFKYCCLNRKSSLPGQ